MDSEPSAERLQLVLSRGESLMEPGPVLDVRTEPDRSVKNLYTLQHRATNLVLLNPCFLQLAPDTSHLKGRGYFKPA